MKEVVLTFFLHKCNVVICGQNINSFINEYVILTIDIDLYK